MVNLQLDYGQVKSLVEQLPQDEVDRLTEFLEKRKYRDKIRSFREKMKDVPLTMEEITAEVEAVREERYRERSH